MANSRVLLSLCVISVAVVVVADDDEGRIYFPDEVAALHHSCSDCNNQIPIEEALRLSTITDEKQLFREFFRNAIVAGENVPVHTAMDMDNLVSDRLGGDSNEPVLSKLNLPSCTPELRAVRFPVPPNRSLTYLPGCTRVEQCGGCCFNERLSCQPSETEQLNFKVCVLEWRGGRMTKGFQIVSLQKHKKCKCVCDIKEEDCTSLQEYNKNDCRCVCKDKTAIVRCNEGSNTRRWNSTSCSCECVQQLGCSWGHSFSPSSCRCEPDEPQRFPSYSIDGGK